MAGETDTHVTDDADSQKRVERALILTGSFVIVEVVGGLLSGSLALLADAGHMLTDTLSLALASIAFRLSRKPADARRSYGYSRLQILAAFVNGIALVCVVAWVVVEAISRFLSPIPIMGGTMLTVAVAGLLVNILAFAMLHGGDQRNLNVRGAALHVMGDLLGSVAAITAAVVIMLTGWFPIDPLLSLFVAALIARSAWVLLGRSGHILLEGAPEDFDPERVRSQVISGVTGVVDVHHIHVWNLNSDEVLLTMHIVVAEGAGSPEVVSDVKAVLARDFGIEHSTIEPERGGCADG